jgi:hypothetical protein
MIRAYPIRMTRSNWRIPLLQHAGSGLEHARVRISEFNIEDTSWLYEPDTTVIPDTFFTITVVFPLSYSLDVEIITSLETGFTLKQILYTIKLLYSSIYNEEDRTSTRYSFELHLDCIECSSKTDVLEVVGISPDFSECCICFKKYSDLFLPCKLRCGHVYHVDCIEKWLKTSRTCPLCREGVSECGTCDGSGISTRVINETVIPRELRSGMERETTDGWFGIHTYDFEDLVLTDISYNKSEKRLSINVEGSDFIAI